jgi:hypothetical protein
VVSTLSPRSLMPSARRSNQVAPAQPSKGVWLARCAYPEAVLGSSGGRSERSRPSRGVRDSAMGSFVDRHVMRRRRRFGLLVGGSLGWSQLGGWVE